MPENSATDNSSESPLDLRQVARGFRRGGQAGGQDAGELAGMLFVLDMQEALPGVQRLRRWSAETLAPSPGEVLVDVGSGTGAVVRELAERVQPGGRAVGVEPHAGLRQEAASRAASTGGHVEFTDGDAVSLPLQDGSVDVLWCERVWQHLNDPAAAAREVARVLAPGGRAAILDTDWATLVFDPCDLDVQRRINQSFLATQPNPVSGRSLRRHLTRAGLRVDPDIGSSAFIWPDQMLGEGSVMRQNVSRAVEAGAVAAAEGERFVQEFLAAAELGEAFAAVTMFAAIARRPV